MAEKKWVRPIKAKKKREKHVCVCQSCMKFSTDKGMSEEMYMWVDSGDHNSLHCLDCVAKYDLKVAKPYKDPSKPRGRPKGSKNKTND